MSNHHLRNKDLSLKAKGLLSQGERRRPPLHSPHCKQNYRQPRGDFPTTGNPLFRARRKEPPMAEQNGTPTAPRNPDPETSCMEFDIEKGRFSFCLTSPYNEERWKAAASNLT